MNREILFKAKRIDNGEWVEGGIYIGNYAWIVTTDKDGKFVHYMVDETTICQYTGLTDKNGVKIWENDAIRYKDDIINKEKIDLIEYNETHASFVRLHKSQMGLQYLYINEAIAGKSEVIGNIFDNPELLESEE